MQMLMPMPMPMPMPRFPNGLSESKKVPEALIDFLSNYPFLMLQFSSFTQKKGIKLKKMEA